MAKNVIKWTWFHRCYDGKNRVVQNTVIDHAVCPNILRMFFEQQVQECLSRRGFMLYKREQERATFIARNGDYINLRIC